MVGYQVPLFDAAVFVSCELVKDLTQMPPQLTVQNSTATFWNENNVKCQTATVTPAEPGVYLF